VTKKWLLDRWLQVLPWPSNSPDMNPIEHVWSYLDAAVCTENPQPTNRQELWEALEQQWYKIPSWYIRGLYKSMPWHIAVLVRAKGGHTKY
jgi:transposase